VTGRGQRAVDDDPRRVVAAHGVDGDPDHAQVRRVREVRRVLKVRWVLRVLKVRWVLRVLGFVGFAGFSGFVGSSRILEALTVLREP